MFGHILANMIVAFFLYLPHVYVKNPFYNCQFTVLFEDGLLVTSYMTMHSLISSLLIALISRGQYLIIKSPQSHPNLGWLFVFSSFPLRQPPQQLLSFTSKSFELNLRYLAHRIYVSGEMCWMTCWWPWPKVTAVASISQNLLVCTIKWEPFIGLLHNMAALLPLSWLFSD